MSFRSSLLQCGGIKHVSLTFIFKYLIYFNAIVYGVKKISFSDCLLLIIETDYFCVRSFTLQH